MESAPKSFRDVYKEIFDKMLAPKIVEFRKQAWIKLMDELRYKEHLPLVLVRERATWEGAEGWSYTMMYEIASGCSDKSDMFFYSNGEFYYDQNVENGVVHKVKLDDEIHERILLGRMDEIIRLGHTTNNKKPGVHLRPGFYFFTWSRLNIDQGFSEDAQCIIGASDVTEAIKKWRRLAFANFKNVEKPIVFCPGQRCEIKMINEAGCEMKSWSTKEKGVRLELK